MHIITVDENGSIESILEIKKVRVEAYLYSIQVCCFINGKPVVVVFHVFSVQEYIIAEEVEGVSCWYNSFRSVPLL